MTVPSGLAVKQGWRPGCGTPGIDAGVSGQPQRTALARRRTVLSVALVSVVCAVNLLGAGGPMLAVPALAAATVMAVAEWSGPGPAPRRSSAVSLAVLGGAVVLLGLVGAATALVPLSAR